MTGLHEASGPSEVIGQNEVIALNEVIAQAEALILIETLNRIESQEAGLVGGIVMIETAIENAPKFRLGTRPFPCLSSRIFKTIKSNPLNGVAEAVVTVADQAGVEIVVAETEVENRVSFAPSF
jgi:hypothetical protein